MRLFNPDLAEPRHKDLKDFPFYNNLKGSVIYLPNSIYGPIVVTSGVNIPKKDAFVTLNHGIAFMYKCHNSYRYMRDIDIFGAYIVRELNPSTDMMEWRVVRQSCPEKHGRNIWFVFERDIILIQRWGKYNQSESKIDSKYFYASEKDGFTEYWTNRIKWNMSPEEAEKDVVERNLLLRQKRKEEWLKKHEA